MGFVMMALMCHFQAGFVVMEKRGPPVSRNLFVEGPQRNWIDCNSRVRVRANDWIIWVLGEKRKRRNY